VKHTMAAIAYLSLAACPALAQSSTEAGSTGTSLGGAGTSAGTGSLGSGSSSTSPSNAQTGSSYGDTGANTGSFGTGLPGAPNAINRGFGGQHPSNSDNSASAKTGSNTDDSRAPQGKELNQFSGNLAPQIRL
jgi:hypothetical protein